MRLPRTVKILAGVSLLQDAASEMLYPVLPLFLTGTLGAPVAIVGIIEGIAEATAAGTKVLSGRWADRMARKPLVTLGYGISSLAKPLIGLATGWPLVLFARFADRVGKGIRTSPRDALLAAGTPAEIRGRAFGFHRAADTTGAVIGPLLGLALYELLDHRLRPLFFVAAIPALASVLLIRLVHEPSRAPAAPPPPPARTAGNTDRNPTAIAGRSSVEVEVLPRPYWRVVTFLTLFGLVNFPDALLILRAKELGLGFTSVIAVYALYNVSYASLSYPAGRLADRLPHHYIVSAGLGFFAVAYAGLGLASTSGWAWFLLPLYGGYTALTDGVGKAWISNLVPDTALGRAQGSFQGLSGGAIVVAGTWAGLTWAGTGRIPLLVAGTAAGAMALGLVAFGGRLGGAGYRA